MEEHNTMDDLAKIDENALKEIMDDLSSDERDEVMRILAEYQANGYSASLQNLYDEDYEEIPVDIDTFIDSEEYAGWFTNNGNDIYPYWREQLRTIFNPNESYSEIAISGSIGTGKSHISVLSLAYCLYNLMCLKDPHGYYRIAKGGYIYIVFFNATIQLSQGVAYTKFQSLLQNSPWFLKRGKVTGTKYLEYVPDRPIRFTVGSQMEHSIGKDIIYGIMDEVNFVKGANVMMEKSKIMKTYNCIHGDTIVRTGNGDFSIESIVDKEVEVLTQDSHYNIQLSAPSLVKNTKDTKELISLELEDGTILKVTPDHKLRLANGEYKEASLLTEDDILMEDINWNNIFDISIWRQFNLVSEENLLNYLGYIKLIYDKGNRNLEYSERHHILPKSFMINNIVIELSPREHFIAHRMLLNCFSGVYNRSVSCAYMFMCKGVHSDSYKVSEEEYEEARLSFRDSMSGENHPNYGVHWSDDTRKRMSDNHADFSDKNHPMYGRRGEDSPNYGRITIHKDNVTRRVKREDLNYYLDNGYEFGESEDLISRCKQINIGRVHIFKDNEEKAVKMEDLDLYLNDGWNIGILNDRHGENNTTYGTRVVNRDGIIRFIDKDELDSYLKDGYSIGTGLKAHNKDMVCINDGKNNKFVYEYNLEYYLDNGYQLGMIRGKPNRPNNVLVTNLETKKSMYISPNDTIPDGYVKGLPSEMKHQCKYKYMYDNREFYGREEIIRYIRCNTKFTRFSSTTLRKICSGIKVRGYDDLYNKIERMYINEN